MPFLQQSNILTPQKSNVLALVSLTYVISWLITMAALNIYVINPSEFAIGEYGIYLGPLTALQGTALTIFITAGGLAMLTATFFVLVKIGDNLTPRIATYWKNQEIPIENAPKYNPTPYPETKTYPLELGNTISTITNNLKTHPYKTGIPLILLGPALLGAFSIYAQKMAPALSGYTMFQILTIAIPTLSILSILIGTLIIANAVYEKRKKEINS